MIVALLIAFAGALPLASGHASIWHPSMYGFNVTDKTFPYDNRPVAPLTNYTFEQWWFHGHLDYPPNPGDIFELPAGQPATTEIACDKGATTWWNSSQGGDVRQGDSPCPNSSPAAYHTTGFDDLKGCALAIAYESDVTKIQPEDFTVFSINQTCVWNRFTDFQVPARMPPCPPGGCHCAWFWIHSQDSGGEQNYMTGFKCNITGSTSNVPLAKPQVPRRCGADPDNGKPNAAPGNCTYGAKQPFYWFQAERNNMFEGTYSPPFYLDLYNFKDGAQDDIFVDSYPNGLPPPSPNSTVVPTPFLGNAVAQTSAAAGSTTATESATSTYVSSSAGGSASPSVSSTFATMTGSSLSGETSSTAETPTNSPSASTVSQTASFSSAFSTVSSELPLSTNSVSPPLASTSNTLPVSSAATPPLVALTTSTITSTVVVTVTSGALAASTSAVATSGTTFSSASSSATTFSATVESSALPSSQGFQTAGPSTIFLNQPTSPAVSSVSASASSAAQSSSITSASQSDGANGAAPTVIDLNYVVEPTGKSYTVDEAVHPGILAAAPTNAACKRQFRRKVALRRRAEPSVAPPVQTATEVFEEPTILSRINVPGLRRHRRLQQRSSLWDFF